MRECENAKHQRLVFFEWRLRATRSLSGSREPREHASGTTRAPASLADRRTLAASTTSNSNMLYRNMEAVVTVRR